MFQMEAELEQFRKKSTQLELTISDLKLKLKATDKERQKEIQKVCLFLIVNNNTIIQICSERCQVTSTALKETLRLQVFLGGSVVCESCFKD